MRFVSSYLCSFGLVLALTACGGADPVAGSETTLASGAASHAGGEVAATSTQQGTLRLTGAAGTRTLGGALASDYIDLATLDAEQGRLTAYFGAGDAAFGLTLNLGAPFAVGSRSVSTGPVVFEMGEGFGQRVDIRTGNLAVTAFDAAARSIALRIEGTTLPEEGQAPEAFVVEANLVVPARAQ